MLLSVKMITGFNTDVPHGGQVYHVQTEDRGRDHPVLESLVYVGGTVIARKRTPYSDEVESGVGEEAIAALLRKQHQVIIAAIKAGRIADLMKHSSGERAGFGLREKAKSGAQKTAKPEAESRGAPESKPAAATEQAAKPERSQSVRVPASLQKPAQKEQAGLSASGAKPPARSSQSNKGQTGELKRNSEGLAQKASQKASSEAPSGAGTGRRTTGSLRKESTGNTGRVGLNLDQVISDYLKRSSEQGKLDLKVLSPSVFVAGKSISLRIQVSRGGAAEPEAIVTVKVIGTAFKPQVYMGRSDSDGATSFNIALPAFSAGTAAIVIEAQSNRGRGELKQLIRRG